MFRAEAFAILGDDLDHLGRCGHGWFGRRRMRRAVAQFMEDLARLADGDLHRYEAADTERLKRSIDQGIELIERWMARARPSAARPLATAIYRIRALEEDIYEHWRLQTAGHLSPDASATPRSPAS
ncbi:MAG TPA: hypothetical protein VND92_08305 [Vicinamibacterales bacterium]|nr:hypothetical protein [Vicinamibacterales bacterium]